MGQFVALLRGVNVGPTTRVPMGELRALLEQWGARSVGTHLNSGNAFFDVHHSPKTLDAVLTELISERFGFTVDVTCRTKKQLTEVLALDPLERIGVDDSRYVIAFASVRLRVAALREVLAGDYPGGELCAADGREFYIWSPDGVSKSKSAVALGRADAAPFFTVRNARTVAKLIELIPAAG
jgi:uncharacterized protein (DUF1697 family)